MLLLWPYRSKFHKQALRLFLSLVVFGVKMDDPNDCFFTIHSPPQMWRHVHGTSVLCNNLSMSVHADTPVYRG